jgi:hypothetical protein
MRDAPRGDQGRRIQRSWARYSHPAGIRLSLTWKLGVLRTGSRTAWLLRGLHAARPTSEPPPTPVSERTVKSARSSCRAGLAATSIGKPTLTTILPAFVLCLPSHPGRLHAGKEMSPMVREQINDKISRGVSIDVALGVNGLWIAALGYGFSKLF